MYAHAFQPRYPVGLAVSRMSSHLYSFGNGIIGNVASSGKYQWLSFSDLNMMEVYPDEWQHQLAAGIKTILLVPVGTHGVVQLGSFELVEEDTMFVADINDLFNSYNNSWGFSSTISTKDDLRTNGNSHPLLRELKGLGTGHISDKGWTPNYSDFPLPPVFKESVFLQSDETGILDMSMHQPYESSQDAMCDFTLMVPTKEPLYQDRCINNSFIFDCKGSNLTTEDLLFTFPQCNNEAPDLFSGLSAFLNSCTSEVNHEKYGSCLVADEIDQPILTEVLGSDTNEINCEITDVHTQSPRAGILCNPDDYVPYSTIEDCWLSPVNHCSSISEFERVLANETDVECLVSSMVAELYNHSGGVLPDTLNREESSDDHHEEPVSFPQAQSKCQDDVSYMDNSVSQSQVNTGASSGSGSTLMSSPTGSSSSMNGSTLINEEKPHQVDLGTDKCKTKKPVPVGKKRPRPDDSNKPRPRDRQLIQDRVKELRDLVPNGTKCSIDALLDRTIKHMLFLRSISTQAEKLKKCSRSKVLGPDREPLEFDDENYGVTWAYELDSQPEACPIVVKDLDQQGHMLIEMLCMEYGDFLEIAQVMRRLRLTILKGVMENRAEKLWAHFVVEATKGFNRMEILWPLMQLLQQNRIPLTARF